MQTNSKLRLACLTLLTIATSATSLRADDPPQYEIKIEQLKAQPTMSTRFTTAPADIAAAYGEAFGAVYSYVMPNGGDVTGPPFGRYHKMTDDEFEIEAGLPVAKTLPGNDDVKPGELPAGPAATLLYVGPYESLGAAHNALTDWARTHDKKPAGTVWECYVSGPGKESDPAKYETKLFLPLETDDAK